MVGIFEIRNVNYTDKAFSVNLGLEADDQPVKKNDERHNKVDPEENEDQEDDKTVLFEPGPDLVSRTRQEPEKDLRAVQGRDGHQVENGKRNVHKDDEADEIGQYRQRAAAHGQERPKD